MSEDKTHSETNGPVFAPQEILSQMQQFMGPWATVAAEQLDRWLAASEQLGAWQREGVERLDNATDDLGTLVKRGLRYSSDLAEQARTTSVQSARAYLDTFTPRA